MSIKYLIALAFFSAGWSTAFCQAQPPAGTVPKDSLDRAVWRSGHTVNPTSYGVLDIPAQTILSARYSFGRSDGMNSPFQGDGHDRFAIEAFGYGVRKGKDIFSGYASFETGTRRHTAWTNVVDVDLLYPYIVSDDTGGDYIDENYHLAGSYSRYFGRHIAGIRALYNGNMAHRPRDPRPKNTSSALTLNPGWSFRISEKHTAGAFLEYIYYKQHVSISVTEPNRDYVFYILRGMGLYDYKFSTGGSSFGRYYRSNGVRAGVQWEKTGRNAFDLIAAFRYRSVETEESDHRLPYDTRRTGVELEASYRRTIGLSDLTVKAEVHAGQQKGYESVYERVQSDAQTNVQVWKLLSRSLYDKIRYFSSALDLRYHQRVSDGFHLWYGLGVSYRSGKENFLQPAYHMQAANLYLGGDIGMRQSWSKNNLSISIRAVRKENVSSAIQAADGELGVREMLLPLYDYLRMNYTDLKTHVVYDFPVKNLRIAALASGGYAFGKEQSNRWEATVGLSVSL